MLSNAQESIGLGGIQELDRQQMQDLLRSRQFQQEEFGNLLVTKPSFRAFREVIPGSFIPPKYQGEERDKLESLILQLQQACPECGQVEQVPDSPYNILRFPSRRAPNVAVSDQCAIPNWLQKSKTKLLIYVASKGVDVTETDCDRKLFEQLIENTP